MPELCQCLHIVVHDRVVADHRWMLLFSKALIEHLAIENSNHCPIILKTEGTDQFVRKPFKFIEAWASDPNCATVVEGA